MNRTWAAISAAAIAIVVLVALIFLSRPLAADAYSRHYAQLSALNSSETSFDDMRSQLNAARRGAGSVGNAIAPLQSRLRQDRQTLAVEFGSDIELAPLWRDYNASVDAALTASDAAQARMQTFGAALRLLREEGPAAVQTLRNGGDSGAASDLYATLLAVYEFAQPASTYAAQQLRERVATLADDDRAMPTFLLDVTVAMESVLDSRDTLDEALASLSASGLKEAAQALRNAQSASHAARVRRQENARLLVSLYSLLLFAGLGFLGYRLQRSYREINDVNRQLQMANDDLERRVDERTRDVQKAYTDLQQSQVQLVQAEKMSSLGQLVAGISHEINTPLLYLQSNVTLNKEALQRVARFIDACHEQLLPRLRPGEDKSVARERFLGGLKILQHQLVDDEVRDDVQEVLALTDDNLEGLAELTQLAQGLKDFSRLDRAPVDAFNVNDGVRRTLTIAKSMLKMRIQVTTEFGDVPAITCAPSQINQVLLNLITNAAQAIEGEGQIRIVSACRDNHVTIAISDSGCGIPADIMARIRDPFFTTKPVGTGTGLGLSICEEILRQHGGRLDIESAPGAGSTFTVVLPVAASAPADEQELPDAAAATAPASPAPASPAPASPAPAGHSALEFTLDDADTDIDTNADTATDIGRTSARLYALQD